MTAGPRLLIGLLAVFALVVAGDWAGVWSSTFPGAAFRWARDLDPRIWQAILGGSFLALGWIFNGWQNRRVAAKLRSERLRDAHRAIFAEIDVYLSNYFSEDVLDRDGGEMIDRMTKDDTFVPLIPRERHDRLFRALEAEIHILPRVTIDPIVSYYTQLSSIEMLVEDMRGDTFATFESSRRIAMYRDYIEMRKQALIFGRLANRVIVVSAKDGKEAAEREALRLSNPPADRSAT